MRRALGLGIALALAGACRGPAPTVQSVRVEPSRPRHVLVTVGLQNAGGTGQATVDVTLHDRRSGRIVGAETFAVALRAGESVSVTRELAVPDAADVGAEARAAYPEE